MLFKEVIAICHMNDMTHKYSCQNTGFFILKQVVHIVTIVIHCLHHVYFKYFMNLLMEPR
jgi:hypothetical protein